MLSLERLIQFINYDYNESGYGGFGIGYKLSNAYWADDTELRNFKMVDLKYYDHDTVNEKWWEGLQYDID